jgi:hypothetical protein
MIKPNQIRAYNIKKGIIVIKTGYSVIRSGNKGIKAGYSVIRSGDKGIKAGNRK